MPQTPLVTVLMSVFNGAAFLPEAVHGILGQTFTDFEFLILNDGSTDESGALLNAIRDSRVRVVQNPENLGLTRSLAEGVTLCKGRYIARMDADDIAFRRRLGCQVDFLERHPGVALLGSSCEVIDERGRRIGRWKRPLSDLEIRWASLVTNPFLHSTVMMRREVLAKHNLNYDPAFKTAQDYELWTRLLKFGEGANVAEPLIQYRMRSGITGQQRESQLKFASEIAARTARVEAPGAIVKPEQVRRFWEVYFDEGGAAVATDDWIGLSLFYRTLLIHFAARRNHQPAAALRRMRRRQSAEVIRSMVHRRFPKGCGGLLKTVLREDPWLPIWCAFKLLAKTSRPRRWGHAGSPAWSAAATG